MIGKGFSNLNISCHLAKRYTANLNAQDKTILEKNVNGFFSEISKINLAKNFSF
jgi:hypothetical protein